MKYPQGYPAFPQRRGIFALLSILAILSVTLFATHPAHAQRTQSTSHLAATPNSLTVIVLDMSGSMATNDPRGYRCSAVDAFIDLSGPGNYISVISLDGTKDANGNLLTGPHNFGVAPAPWTPDPVDMSVQSKRDSLKQTIQTKSQNCKPDATTPTYDALNKALQVLQANSQAREIPGSVILLTDGAPDDSNGDTVDQINAIDHDLLPQFKQHNWPIDTIALGENGSIGGSNAPFVTFHDFLQAVSNTTTGKFYADSKGIVPGTNALNIAPFFTDIFARYNHRTVKNDIPATTLNGDTTARNFSVTPYTDHLDIVVVKDNTSTRVTLKNASTQETTAGAGTHIYPNPYYVIFSIDAPQSGTWELDVTGSGQFLMNSLKHSLVKLSTLQVSEGAISTANSALALGQPMEIKTQLTYQNQPVLDNTYTLQGTLSYSGAAGSYNQPFTLQRDDTGTYHFTLTTPEDSPAGSYQLQVKAFTTSADNIIDSLTTSVRMERFPTPELLTPDTKHPTRNTINTEAVAWDPILHLLYSLPLVSRLDSWPLQGHPAGKAEALGEVTLLGQIYTGASLSAQSALQNAHTPGQDDIYDDGKGLFHIHFPVTTNGLYTLHFTTSGTFNDSFGDTLATQRQANVTIVPATPVQEGIAWLITIFYLLCLITILNILRFVALAHPKGSWLSNHDGEVGGSFSFQRSTRGPIQWYFKPNLLYSEQAKMPQGLLFRFRHGNGIEVRPEGVGGRNWQTGDGRALRTQFSEERELRYRPTSFAHDEDAIGATYLIQATTSRSTRNSVSRYDDSPSSPRTRRLPTYEDEDDYGSRRRPSPRSQKRKPASRKRRNEDDWF